MGFLRLSPACCVTSDMVPHLFSLCGSSGEEMTGLSFTPGAGKRSRGPCLVLLQVLDHNWSPNVLPWPIFTEPLSRHVAVKFLSFGSELTSVLSIR